MLLDGAGIIIISLVVVLLFWNHVWRKKKKRFFRVSQKDTMMLNLEISLAVNLLRLLDM